MYEAAVALIDWATSATTTTTIVTAPTSATTSTSANTSTSTTTTSAADVSVQIFSSWWIRRFCGRILQ